MIESFYARISKLKRELYNKHTNKLRAISRLKRHNGDYNILKQYKEGLIYIRDLSPTESIHDNKFIGRSFSVSSASTEVTGRKQKVTSDVTNVDDDIYNSNNDIHVLMTSHLRKKFAERARSSEILS